MTEQTLKKTLMNLKFVIAGMVMLFAGICTVFLCHAYVGEGLIGSIVRDLGIALITAGSVVLAHEWCVRKQFLELVEGTVRRGLQEWGDNRWSRDLRDLLPLADDLREVGLRRIHRRRADRELKELLRGAGPRASISVLGVALKYLCPGDVQDILEEKLQDGCEIRLLLLDPKSPFVQQRGDEEGRDRRDVFADIGAATSMLNSFVHGLPENLRSNIKIGHYDGPPTYFICATDKTMLLGFYLPGDRGEEMPHFEFDIKRGGAYEAFAGLFEWRWKTRVETSSPASPSGEACG